MSALLLAIASMGVITDADIAAIIAQQVAIANLPPAPSKAVGGVTLSTPTASGVVCTTGACAATTVYRKPGQVQQPVRRLRFWRR